MVLKISIGSGLEFKNGIGKWYWNHWKMELFENGIGNIGKWNYWKMVLKKLEIILF